MISARKLLKDSCIFLLKHPSIFFYNIIYILPLLFIFGELILLFLCIGTLSILTLTWPDAIYRAALVALGSIGGTFLLIIIYLTTIILSLGLTFYIQTALRKGKTSIYGCIKKALNTCVKAPWFLPVYLIYSFFSQFDSPVWPFVVIALLYVHQQLFDEEYSFFECFAQSWRYFKRSWITLLKFLILLVMAPIAFIILMLFSASLSIVCAYSLPFVSWILSGLAIFLSISCFVFMVFEWIILRIAVNKLYLEMKEE